MKELFPEVFCEDKIDFGRLKGVLGEYTDDKEERYSFNWKGKSKAIRIAQTPSTGTLRPAKEESKSWDSTENLYIEGDNLEVLKLLQKTYNNKVKMIYIDPPYNTGNDFVYHDDFRDNIKNYLEITGQVDGEGRKLGTNVNESGRFHTNWLNMMYPRLKLAKNLLSDDGVIIISINEVELFTLKLISDEIFGADNYLTTFSVKVRHEDRILKGDKDFHEVIEYLLMYRKTSKHKTSKIIKDNTSIEEYIYKIIEKNTQPEIRNMGGKTVQIFRPGEYEILKEDYSNEKLLKSINIRGSLKEGNSSGRFYTGYLQKIVKERGYLYKVLDMGADSLGCRYFLTPESEKRANGDYFQGVPLEKKDYKEVPYANFLDYQKEFNRVGYEGDIEFRNGKKPIEFLKKLMEISGIYVNNDATILDFFSGSASTAHAVVQLNSEDNGKRKFIMIQIPQKVDEDSNYSREGLNTICEIGKERIRRAGEKILEENKNKEGIENLDIGFKVFKLDSSNIKKWDVDGENIEISIDNMIDNFVSNRTEEDIVYEIMIKYGIDLTYPVELRKIAAKKVFSIGYGALFICLDNEITLEVVEGIVKLKEELNPEITRVVFKDNGFKNDSVKTNAIHILRRNKIQEIMSI